MAQAMNEFLPDDDPRAFEVAGRVLMDALWQADMAHHQLLNAHTGIVVDASAPDGWRVATAEERRENERQALDEQRRCDARALSARLALTRALAAREREKGERHGG